MDPSNLTSVFSILLGGNLQFILENIFATEEGYTTFKNKGWGNSVEYAFGKLGSGNINRYNIIMLMNVLVSSLLFKPLYDWLTSSNSTKFRVPTQNNYFFGCNNNSVINGLITFLLSLIILNVYSSQAKNLWTHPDENKNEKKVISTSIILLSLTILSLLFLLTDTGNKGINGNDFKIKIVYGSLIIVSILYMMGYLSDYNQLNDDLEENDESKKENI